MYTTENGPIFLFESSDKCGVFHHSLLKMILRELKENIKLSRW